ncbi:helix-turn-helix transcriptional regulator [Microbulbifer sp. SAOS-129_SWC]|uniref:helix-turn-helix domain-containing protein n=1 Tax=Microbulbifer sp. SAOS-129_SWC TaxID=3145235 RepID=UPI0032178588
MLTTVDILDVMKERLGSDYKTAKLLDIHPNRITHLRNKGGTLTDANAIKIAAFLGVPVESIILNMVAERSRNSPAFDVLERIAEQHTPKTWAAAS